jgi:hypothetical protein
MWIVGVLCAAASAGAQDVGAFRAAGYVRDSMGTPIPRAIVFTPDARAETDSLGRFAVRLTRVDSTTVTVRRMGFEPVTFTMLTDSLALNDLNIELQAIPTELPGVGVRETRMGRVPTLERFAERARDRRGLGFFLTREEIVRREGAQLSGLVTQAQGVRIVRLRNGQSLVRFTRWTHKGNGCAPRIWVDGVIARGLELDDIPSADVEAMELYASPSSVPSEFTAAEFDCGVIAVWTRRPILRTR